MASFLGLLFRTIDARWGAGKGSRLTAVEVDENFWAVDQAIKALNDNPTLPLEIQSVDVTGNQMTFTLSDGVTTLGPYTLPTASFNVTGPFQGNHDYARFDLLTANDGMYLVLQPHTSLAAFDPDDTSGGTANYYLLFPFPTNYDIGFFFPGKPGYGIADGGAMFGFRASSRTPFYLPAGLDGSSAGLLTAPTLDLSFSIYQGAADIGALTFAPGNTVGVFDFPAAVQFTEASALRVLRASELDDTALDLSVSFAAIKGTVP